MKYKDIGRKDYWVFNSMHELSEILRHNHDRDSVIGVRSSSDGWDGGDWCDTRDLEEAYDALQYGKEYDGFNNMLKEFTSSGHTTKRQIANGVVGHTVIVPLYLQGIPTSMVTTKSVINNKIINMFYNSSVPGCVSSSTIMDTTKRMMEKVMNYEKQGYRVNLYVVRVNGSNDRNAFGLRIKSDRERFNPKKMAFPLVSSSFNRRIGFRVAECLYETSIGSGYGSGIMDVDTTRTVIKRMYGIEHFELWNYEGLSWEG